jgi:copper chaperone
MRSSRRGAMPDQERIDELDVTETRDVTLSVPDVSCEHCVHTIAQTLGALPGIARAQTDLPSKTVQVRFDPRAVSLDQIKESLDEAGYPATDA